MSEIVEILVPSALDHGFDYRVEEGDVPAGTIVSVPLGSRQTLGVVWGEGKGQVEPKKIKAVSRIHGDYPPFSARFRKFLEWTAWYNGAPLGAVLKMALPIADIEKQGRLHSVVPHIEHMALAELSEQQREAEQKLMAKLDTGFSVSLLDGVTGSGKTEVYFDVIAKVLSGQWTVDSGQNQSCPPSTVHRPQVLVLLPEIALSVQWLARFKKRFGVEPVLWHSHVTPARRREAWKAIVNGDAQVVVGARSALFLPYRKLSLVVVDEEHDTSYKQEDGVMYHARDMAIARASHEHFPVVLVSATPSLESVYNVKGGKYDEVTLPIRHAAAQLPDIHLLDMRDEKLDRGNFISQPLRTAITEALAGGHQSMLFLNRRGYAPLVLCRHCGHRFQCPNCTSWLVLHRIRDSGFRIQEESGASLNPESRILNPSLLHCHHCDYRIPLPSACPECRSEHTLHACGPGVERIVEEVRAFLPQARVATMASDSAEGQQELTAIIEAMERGEVDVLVGTQMIAKGHHFGGLAVVGVVDADLGLAGGDLRAAEKTYQLLHQVAGRAGREQVAGHVYLQSYAPDHPVMQALSSGRRDAFFAAELAARELAQMPPFSRLAALIVEGGKENEVQAVVKVLAQHSHVQAHLVTYGPAPAPLYMLRGKYRYRFLVKADRAVNIPNYMRKWVAGVPVPRSVRIRIDIDPVSFL